jgi:hypothetical protein
VFDALMSYDFTSQLIMVNHREIVCFHPNLLRNKVSIARTRHVTPQLCEKERYLGFAMCGIDARDFPPHLFPDEVGCKLTAFTFTSSIRGKRPVWHTFYNFSADYRHNHWLERRFWWRNGFACRDPGCYLHNL